MRVSLRFPVLLAAAAFTLTACNPDLDQSSPLSPDGLTASLSLAENDLYTGRYLILGTGSRLPLDLEARVSAAGGQLVGTIPEIGVGIAVAHSPDFLARAGRIAGVESVAPDIVLQWTDPDVGRGEAFTLEEAGLEAEGESLAPNDPFYLAFQWAPQAIGADQAWAAGHTGQGVRVAILDGGIRDTHVDLAPNLDVAASRSFTTGAWNTDTGTFWHGTHVAGIVAAAANGIGTVGIAPNATLIGVKVLHNGSGPFESILNGIVYAATPLELGGAGAHVMNLSLGATLPYRELWDDKDFRDFFRELTKAYDRATRYAYQRGVTVIVSAGNGATNFDVEKGLFKIPAQNQHVLSISATGPHGWALGATDFERPAYYTDHGRSLVDLAAPGGTLGLWVVDGVDAICTVGGFTSFCETFDLIMSTTRGSGASNTTYGWAQGTSMAAPAAAGLAALIIEKNGGSMHPAQVRTWLQQSALDLGEPGNDIWYGHGWINAWRAVQ